MTKFNEKEYKEIYDNAFKMTPKEKAIEYLRNKSWNDIDFSMPMGKHTLKAIDIALKAKEKLCFSEVQAKLEQQAKEIFKDIMKDGIKPSEFKMKYLNPFKTSK